jgi:hypothetical protein
MIMEARVAAGWIEAPEIVEQAAPEAELSEAQKVFGEG